MGTKKNYQNSNLICRLLSRLCQKMKSCPFWVITTNLSVSIPPSFFLIFLTLLLLIGWTRSHSPIKSRSPIVQWNASEHFWEKNPRRKRFGGIFLHSFPLLLPLTSWKSSWTLFLFLSFLPEHDEGLLRLFTRDIGNYVFCMSPSSPQSLGRDREPV